jgi:hypothetical protein
MGEGAERAARRQAVITREQFELAARIKKAQDEILWWEQEDRHYPPEDPERRKRFEKVKKISVELHEEELMALTGNPRGFLE